MSNNTPEPKAYSPHCAKQWPEVCFNDQNFADLINAINGASVLAHLLVADDRLRDQDSGDALPFNAYHRSGLQSALLVCMDKINVCADALEVHFQVEVQA